MRSYVLTGRVPAGAESTYRARDCDREEEDADRLVERVEMPALGRRHVESGRDQEQDRDANGPVEGDRGSIELCFSLHKNAGNEVRPPRA